MLEEEEHVRSLVHTLKTCDVRPDKIICLKSFKNLINNRTDNNETNIRNSSKILTLFNYIRNFIIFKCLCKYLTKFSHCFTKWRIVSAFIGILAVFVGLVFHYELYTLHGFARFWLYWENIDLHSEQCTLDMPSVIQDTFRPPVDCSMCSNVTEVDRVKDIHPSVFEAKYAYSGRPVVILDGQKNWSAPRVFSFSFFKSIYSNDSPVLYNLDRECQFFPYQTSFKNLKEVFNMSLDKAERLDGQPWYIGWSNCDSAAANIIREHYKRPYFLPSNSEESKTDWIFMGTPGHGAHLHIDHVGNPSWQAQIKGKKRWTLEPPPECYFKCHPLEITVEQGQIIVLDTNIWYHGTFILPGEISITIGSEFD